MSKRDGITTRDLLDLVTRAERGALSLAEGAILRAGINTLDAARRSRGGAEKALTLARQEIKELRQDQPCGCGHGIASHWKRRGQCCSRTPHPCDCITYEADTSLDIAADNSGAETASTLISDHTQPDTGADNATPSTPARPSKTCPECGDDFSTWPNGDDEGVWWVDGQNYCSAECTVRRRRRLARDQRATAEAEGHDYLSTYCHHQLHADCRLACKTCAAVCRCGCHQQMAVVLVDPERSPDCVMPAPKTEPHMTITINQPPVASQEFLRVVEETIRINPSRWRL